MPNIFPLIMRQEYTDIVFFWNWLYRRYDVNVHDIFSIDIEQLMFHS